MYASPDSPSPQVLTSEAISSVQHFRLAIPRSEIHARHHWRIASTTGLLYLKSVDHYSFLEAWAGDMVEEAVKNSIPLFLFFVAVLLALGVSLIIERYRK